MERKRTTTLGSKRRNLSRMVRKRRNGVECKLWHEEGESPLDQFASNGAMARANDARALSAVCAPKPQTRRG